MTKRPETNEDRKTVESFGREWCRFDQNALQSDELLKAFEEYFSIFPWETLPLNSVGLDVGCGSGHWASLVAERVGHLHCLDASVEALSAARKQLSSKKNVTFHHASVATIPIDPGSLDFCYSLGVLHHVPDTAAAIRSCAEVLKPGAPLLLYLYYDFDDRPSWYRTIWKISDYVRSIISRLPDGPKSIATDVIAFSVYWPLSRMTKLLENIGLKVNSLPLSHYRNHSIYTLRTDFRDRFGTPLEQRFSPKQMQQMMSDAGLDSLQYRDGPPYWCLVGRKSNKSVAY